MPRPRYIQRHGNAWMFRLMVPAALRRSIGKREILKSLGPDFKPACRLAHFEAVKANARFEQARRQLEADPDHEATLSGVEIFDLAAQVLIDQERRAASLPLASRVEEAIETLAAIATPDEIMGQTVGETMWRTWQARDGRKIDQASCERLCNFVQMALVEASKRVLLRHTAKAITLNPMFDGITAKSQAHKNAPPVTFGELIEKFKASQTSQAITAKTTLHVWAALSHTCSCRHSLAKSRDFI